MKIVKYPKGKIKAHLGTGSKFEVGNYIFYCHFLYPFSLSFTFVWIFYIFIHFNLLLVCQINWPKMNSCCFPFLKDELLSAPLRSYSSAYPRGQGMVEGVQGLNYCSPCDESGKRDSGESAKQTISPWFCVYALNLLLIPMFKHFHIFPNISINWWTDVERNWPTGTFDILNRESNIFKFLASILYKTSFLS